MIHPEISSQFISSTGDTIHLTLTQPDVCTTSTPVVIIFHGFKGFRNWGFFPFAAQHFADAGCIACRIDFSHNGMHGGNNMVVALDDFATNTVSREFAEACEVIDSMQQLISESGMLPNWSGSINLVGHSRGGGIAMLAGAARADVHRVVVWNSVGTWIRWTPRQREVWVKEGHVHVSNDRTGQTLAMNSSYVEDIENNAESVSLVSAANILSNKLLCIHATNDLTVPLKEIEMLLHESGSGASLQTLANTTHTFGITHPINHITKPFVDVLVATSEFITS